MKRLIIIFAVFVVTACVVQADDFMYHGSILWNDIRATVVRGDYLFCAFHDGIGVINLSLDFGKKRLSSSMELAGAPLRLHLADTLLVVELESGDIALVNAADPRNLRFVGSFTPGQQVFDIALSGKYLYLAEGYNGLMRYDISEPADIRFDDSSMIGIHVIRLNMSGGRLFALDDYNGVLIYDPNGARLGEPVSQLYLPFQAVALTVSHDTIYASEKPSGYMFGSIADPAHPVYLGERPSLNRGDEIAVTPNGVVLANSVMGFELQYGAADSLVDQLFPVDNVRGRAIVLTYQQRPYILYPHYVHGFVAYDISDPLLIDTDLPQLAYGSPGPITQLQFVKSRLHVIGTNNWYEIYDLTDPDHPARTGKLVNPPYQPSGLCTKGDTLFVADVKTNSVFPAVDRGTGDPTVAPPFYTFQDSIGRPGIIPNYFGDGDLLYTSNDIFFDGTYRSDTMILPNVIRWGFANGISAILLNDTLLYHVTSKADLRTYTVDNELQLTQVSDIFLPGRVRQMIKFDTLLYMAGYSVLVASIHDPATPRLTYAASGTGTVYEMQLAYPWLVCAANNGVFIFDISARLPQPLFSGGAPATLIAYDKNVIAASDGRSVKIYTLPVEDVPDNVPIVRMDLPPRLTGYPNPFNPSIHLRVENLTARSEPVSIEVYSILGQRLRTLTPDVDRNQAEVIWDGKDERGQMAASGIYLFLARQGKSRATFKAALLK
jgi:hypothetical protein